MYIAMRPLNVDGTIRQPGEPVPEAVYWKNLPAYTGANQLRQAVSDDEVRATVAQARGVPVETVDLNATMDQNARLEEHARRNMMPGAATGTGLAPMADGSLREPLAGKVLEQVMAAAGNPVGPDVASDDTITTRLTTAAILGDERAQAILDDRAQAAIDEADERHEIVVAAARTPGTRPPEAAEAAERANEESIARAEAEEERRTGSEEAPPAPPPPETGAEPPETGAEPPETGAEPPEGTEPPAEAQARQGGGRRRS